MSTYAHNRFLNSKGVTQADITNLQIQIDALNFIYYKTVEILEDFPTPIANVIYLEAKTTYLITTTIDLGVNRIDCTGGIVAIIGNSSEVSLVSSNNAGAMITSDDTLVLRWISLASTIGPIFALDADAPVSGNLNPAIDWFGVNFVDTTTIGTVANYNNFVGFSMAFLNSGNLTFDGSFGTIAFDTSIFTTPTGSSIIFPATLTITRRFRIQFSSFVTTGANNSISVNAGAVIPDEQYILFRNNFSGGATNYLDGVQSSDDKSSHLNNFGITNSRTLANYAMTGNVTETDCVDSKYIKIAGATTSGALHQRFTQTTSNRAVYNGSETAVFKISSILSLTDGNNISYSTRIGINGTTLADTSSDFTSTGEGKASSISSQAIVELDPGDYFEMFVANLTNDANPICVNLNIIAIKIDT